MVMAQKSPTCNSMNLPYEDLASEVTRRRVSMTTRKHSAPPTRKIDEAREMQSDLGLEQTPPPRTADPPVLAAPPPSPADDPKVS